ncbi:MAG TPA: enoyl-CoA hydratase-related protein [Smithellaceae bacterium]|nr:enoyl-CoA hydratase-related protein [Smithellaceae bacterium]
MFKSITLNSIESVAVIKLNEEKTLNALSYNMLRELQTALDALRDDAVIKVIILWGGESLFGAGANLKEVSKITNSYEAFEYSRNIQVIFNSFENFKKPVIAAIGGYALGGGLELALCCDIRVASEKAKLGLPEVKLGVLPAGGGTARLTRLIGTARAKELIMLGDHITADEAFRLGIVNRVVPDQHLIEEAMKLARTLAQRAPVALTMIKNAISVGANLDLESAQENEAKCSGVLFDTEDRIEGMNAFLEKRKAVFKGK